MDISPIIRPAKQSDANGLVLLLQQLFSIEKDFDFDAARQRKGLAADAAHLSAKISP